MREDEYDVYDLSEFTEEDFAHIDEAVQLVYPEKADDKGGPTVIIELEQPVIDIDSKAPPEPGLGMQKNLSPFQLFRRNQIFSVTDLVAPAWCEVQFDYGLRQMRSRKLERRPNSFISGAGKEIFVEKRVASLNNRTTTRGKLIHKELEREIHPVEVSVEITTDEERWALRLVNMLSSIDCLTTLGRAREMPVFGIIKDHIVVGVIDEILRLPIARDINAPESNHSKTRPLSVTTEGELLPGSASVLVTVEDEHVPQNSPNSDSTPYTINLLDTKTRRSPSIPSHEDTFSSRLQLMLYHRLLSALISLSHPIDFSAIWARLNLDSSKPLSSRFMIQAGLILGYQQKDGLSSLDDLSRAWRDAIRHLDVMGIDTTLKLVYRTQPDQMNGKRKRRHTPDPGIFRGLTEEEQAISRAVEASLKVEGNTESEELRIAIAESILGPQPGRSLPARPNQNAEPVAVQQSLPANIQAAGHIHNPDEGTQEISHRNSPAKENVLLENKPEGSKVIGVVAFTLDDTLLDGYLVHVLQWWHGMRLPRGVGLGQTRRCFTCEYCEGCEWRDMKANELTKR